MPVNFFEFLLSESPKSAQVKRQYTNTRKRFFIQPWYTYISD